MANTFFPVWKLNVKWKSAPELHHIRMELVLAPNFAH
jgi:hypothetical protein